MPPTSSRPDDLAAAARDLHAIDCALRIRNAITAAPTTLLTPAAADPVSALTAACFSQHAQIYQAISAQAAVARQLMIDALGGPGRSSLRGDENLAVPLGVGQVVERGTDTVEADLTGDHGADIDVTLGDRA
jgi:PE family